MKIKHHCMSGHVMKRDGDAWSCTGQINKYSKVDGKWKITKVKCPRRDAWNRVEPYAA